MRLIGVAGVADLGDLLMGAYLITDHGGLDISVSAPTLPAVPAAVEVAAYRIATEALTNVARHSRARQTSVSLRIDETRLCLDFVDDGVGVPAQRGTGVGLAAMAERAAELGGSCSIGPGASGGTAVVAVLPLEASS